MVNERIRRMSSWAIAPSTPTTIVAPAMRSSRVAGLVSSVKKRSWVRTMAYTPTFVRSPAKIAVMGEGAVG
jgi:hypothetical protein